MLLLVGIDGFADRLRLPVEPRRPTFAGSMQLLCASVSSSLNPLRRSFGVHGGRADARAQILATGSWPSTSCFAPSVSTSATKQGHVFLLRRRRSLLCLGTNAGTALFRCQPCSPTSVCSSHSRCFLSSVRTGQWCMLQHMHRCASAAGWCASSPSCGSCMGLGRGMVVGTVQ